MKYRIIRRDNKEFGVWVTRYYVEKKYFGIMWVCLCSPTDIEESKKYLQVIIDTDNYKPQKDIIMVEC